MRPLLWCQFADGTHLQYACGAYQLIYRAELFGSPGDSLCDRIEVRDIYLHGMQLLCMVALQCLQGRSEEHTSELQSLMRISYAVFCLKKKNKQQQTNKYKTNNSQT